MNCRRLCYLDISVMLHNTANQPIIRRLKHQAVYRNRLFSSFFLCSHKGSLKPCFPSWNYMQYRSRSDLSFASALGCILQRSKLRAPCFNRRCRASKREQAVVCPSSVVSDKKIFPTDLQPSATCFRVLSRKKHFRVSSFRPHNPHPTRETSSTRKVHREVVLGH